MESFLRVTPIVLSASIELISKSTDSLNPNPPVYPVTEYPVEHLQITAHSYPVYLVKILKIL